MRLSLLLSICLLVPTASLLNAAPAAKDGRELSIYFGINAGENIRSEAAIDANRFAILGLDQHVVNSATLPEPAWGDAAKVAPYYPDGHQLSAEFFNAKGETVVTLDEPGAYGARITIDTTNGPTWQIRRTLYRVADGSPLPSQNNEAAALRLIARDYLGRPWQEGDTSLYIFGQWFLWDADVASGDARPHEYFTVYPSGFDAASGKQLPVLFYLHGSGARRFDLEGLKNDPFYESVRPHADKGLLIVVPLSKGQWEAPKFNELVDRVLASEAADPSRLYIGGHSMGGSGTWRVLDGIAERFAAGVPVAGGNVPPMTQAPRYTELPVWALFGENDNPDGQKRTADMVDAINALGGHARFTILPDANHMQSRNRFFASDEVYDWLLQQKKEQ